MTFPPKRGFFSPFVSVIHLGNYPLYADVAKIRPAKKTGKLTRRKNDIEMVNYMTISMCGCAWLQWGPFRLSEKEEMGITRGAQHRVENAFSERYDLTYCHVTYVQISTLEVLKYDPNGNAQDIGFSLLFAYKSIGLENANL
ncbi:hypothetical protein POVCU2_0024270 [Plasmodium ovale curtisi]|uniref:Uncharacterized protein n=1 Tax=Plasmodium ovale curtisi TaxID=864141 RepID=A0A1A8WGQ7_PLAOA|nr:hypothetical protein POVCU2_0024270 [Plasmodium ovale curtisi]SBS92154.1 hypothetical protein POVCU1_022070 [Plasmodium ovale curtisi]